MDQSRAQYHALVQGECLRDDATTTTVKYINCNPLFDGDPDIYVKVKLSVDGFILPVDGDPPATAPTVSDTAGDECMWPVEANAAESFVMTKEAPFLAYSGDAGRLSIRKSSPTANVANK